MKFVHIPRAGALATSIALFAAGVHAEPTAADKETARALVNEGQTAFDSRRYEDALKSFEAAHRIMGVPTTGLRLGKTQAALGLLVEARDTLLGVGRYPKKPDEPTAFAKARIEAEALAEEIAAKIATIQLELPRDPPSAAMDITIDSGRIAPGTEAIPRRVNPGKHVVVAAAKGYETATIEIEVGEGETRKVPLALEKPTLTAGGKQGGSGGGEPPRSTSLSPLVFAGFGVGAAGIGAGTVTGILALGTASSAKDRCDGNRCPRSVESDVDSARTLGTLSTIGFAVGALGVGVGVYGLLNPSKAPLRVTSGLRLEADVGPASLRIRGIF
jgi:hypothetical protein